jgi:hypothetical protein
MAIEKKIEICIGTSETKMVRVRLSLLNVDTQTQHVISRHFHSMELTPGADLARARRLLDQDLAAGWIEKQVWPLIPDEQWADVEAHVAIVHKPEIVAAYQAAQLLALEAAAGE